MEKTPVFEQKRQVLTHAHGARAVLRIEGELPLSDCAAARHAAALFEAFCTHAKEQYFPVAASELEALVGASRGYAFSLHRLSFVARVTRVRAGMCLALSLCYTVGDEVRLWQEKKTYWTADGAYRYLRPPRARKGAKRKMLPKS